MQLNKFTEKLNRFILLPAVVFFSSWRRGYIVGGLLFFNSRRQAVRVQERRLLSSEDILTSFSVYCT